MIIVRLMGGLGNQMFQYPLGRRLSLERDVSLKLDLSWFQTQDKRKFELEDLNIIAEIATQDEIFQKRYFSHNRYFRKAGSIYQNHLPYWKKRQIKEISIGTFDPNILLAPKKCIIQGYWQSEKYFKTITDILLKEFTLKNSIDNESVELAEEMLKSNSVSLHIRRGDYVSDPKINYYHGVLSLDYYRSAIKHIQSQIDTPRFYVFSDDLEWAKKNLIFLHPSTFVERKSVTSSCQEMWLMSNCRHHITANSSFSWWGAWLGFNPDKLVISPKSWFSNPMQSTVDLVPEGWVRI